MEIAREIDQNRLNWLLSSGEPWTRYRTRIDLLGQPEDDPQVQADRAEMLAHPQVKALVQSAATWPGYALQRHNDAGHPLYQMTVLADFGIQANDPGMPEVIDAVMAHQSVQGAFQTMVNVSKAFGGAGVDEMSWMACDAPVLLYFLLAMGIKSLPDKKEKLQKAIDHLIGLTEDNGWRCCVSPESGSKFRGPGRKTDPCPIANVVALKALALAPECHNNPAVQRGVEMLLHHWEKRSTERYYLFGMGSQFRKLKYPFIWYDLLHVVEVLSHFPFARADRRYREMVDVIAAQADGSDRFTPGSMYQAWKGWSFADKKQPSHWLTYLALRLLR